ncbi:MAG: transcription elongation factor GreA [Armatimonadetes bacterium]|nr:transcription elongation factor GreA [Armatimonadota bacterium]
MSERQIILTASGYRRIEKELNELLTVRRSRVAGDIRAAKSFGDVAENPEYESAKAEQAFLEGRILELKSILNSARIIDDRDAPTDVVGVGSVVRVRDLEHRDEWDYTIVGSVEADPEADRISNESPIGQALLGRRVGDTVEVSVPVGKARYQIVSIRRLQDE